MNPEQTIVRQAMKIEDLELQLGESRELILLLAGRVRNLDSRDGGGPVVEIGPDERAGTVRVERVEGGAVRFRIESQMESEGSDGG